MSRNPVQLPVLRNEPNPGPWLACAVWSARVLSGFVVLVSAILLGSVLREHREGLLVNGRIKDLQGRLVVDKGNETLREEIRREDQNLRRIYFARRNLWEQGGLMLAIGGAGLLAALGFAAKLGHKPFLPTGPMPKGPRLDARMKTGIALATLGLVGLGVSAMKSPSSRVVYQPVKKEIAGSQVVEAATSDEEMAKYWPMFRGYGGTGRIADGNYPTQWDGKEGRGVAWATETELGGFSSPVVWGNQVFVACGDKEKRRIVSYDAESGKKLWSVETAGDFGEALHIMEEDTTFSPSTPATDGRRVFAIFPTGELLAADFSGKLLWKKQLGIPDNMYGHASSLLLARGLLVVQYDQGMDAEENKSRTIAYDAATGKEAWKVNRPVAATWSSPMCVEFEGKMQLVLLGCPWTMGYDLSTGKELWRAKGLEGDLAPSPTYGDGMIVYAFENKSLFTIAPGGKGDVTQTLLKKYDFEPLPDIASPVAIGNRALIMSGSGLAAWTDIATGKAVWEHDFERGIHASPIIAGDKIYIIDNGGKTHVIAVGDEFKEIATNELGEDVRATPAFANGKIFIRGKTKLYCIK